MNCLDDNNEALAHATRTLMRRRAFKRAYDAAEMEPCESLNFAPLPPCVDCEDPLSHDNRSGIAGLCIQCLSNRNAASAMYSMKPVNPDSNEPKQPTSLPLWFYPTIILAAVLFGGAVGWVLPRVAFWLGGLFA